MEEIILLYEDIYLFGILLVCIFSFGSTFYYLFKYLFYLYVEKLKYRNFIYKFIISMVVFLGTTIYLDKSEIHSVQYKSIFETFILNNSDIKIKVLEILKDERVTKREYLSIFLGIDEILLESNDYNYKTKILKITNTHKI